MVSPSILHPLRLRQRYSIQHILGARLGRRTLLGYDHIRHRQVVIKYLCFDDPLQASDIKRFRAEINALKTLAHPAIPAYLDDFGIDAHGYRGLMLVQDYIEGQSLYTLIENQRTFTEPEIRNFARQLLKILDYLHSQQPTIIHRDLKPSSLVLSQPPGTDIGQIYLVDFGLVERTDITQTIANEPILISGTPGYRPPEQLGDRAVPATDLYSLGATLIHLATGQHPKTLPQRGLQILFGQELGHMSRSLKAWLRWLTQPKQLKRPTSAGAALQGLEKADEILLTTNPLSLAHIRQYCQSTCLGKTSPADTQLKIFEYNQTLEVLLPPVGWKHHRFGLALLHTTVGIIGMWASLYSVLGDWPQPLIIWQRILAVFIGLGWAYLSLYWGYRGLKAMLVSLFQQVSIQLLPDIILLGQRFPCRPINYQINTYKQDIEDIIFQPDRATIQIYLHRNRTLKSKLEHTLSDQVLGITQSEICWINTILQLWLQQGAPRGAV